MIFFPRFCVNARQLLNQRIRAVVVTDSMFHTSRLSRTFERLQELDKTWVSFLLVPSIKSLEGKSERTPTSRILTRVHESPEMLIHFFPCRRAPTSNPSSGQVEISSALTIWCGFLWERCYSSGCFRSAVLANADIQQSLNALRASNRFEGWPEAARWINCPKIFSFFFLSNQSVCDFVNTQQ